MKHKYDVVTIIDEIGEYKTDKLKNGNKFCSYWFATRKELLIKYLDLDWNSHLPHSETLGYLTEAMLNDGVRVYEWEEDKSNCILLADGAIMEMPPEGKKLGYYHIRAGSSPAYLLSTKKYGNIDTYNSYLREQPKTEYLRHLAWYWWMIKSNEEYFDKYETFYLHEEGNYLNDFLADTQIHPDNWNSYCEKFKEYHGL